MSNVIFTDNFNSYSLGNLNGQGSWTGHVQHQVTSAIVYEGARGGMCSTAGDWLIAKTGYAVLDGRLTMYVYPTAHAGWGANRYWNIQLAQAAPLRSITVRFQQNGNFSMYESGVTERVITTGYADNIWHRVDIEWRSSDYKARARLNRGAWSNWYAAFGGNWAAVGIQRLTLDYYIASAAPVYYDLITAESTIATKVSKISINIGLGI